MNEHSSAHTGAAPASVTEPAVDPALAALLGLGNPEPQPADTQLTIHRTSPEDVKIRQVVVALDGQRIAELLYGQVFTCEIQPGWHQLRVHNTLVWKTARFFATAGSHVHFTCINRLPAGLFYMLVTIGISPLVLTLKPGPPTLVHP